ncbi:hypothetical protein GQ55_5G450000 [Panicum hallii var. hallii]|uniref:Uncharacterized protein n=1 Tax=Panicum hallii var. hallii TaxID=1504633 RepID=A0A2T7DQ38_9POAL|nr:hypothetical protein GQ55_5G450000 [Panicum hallii var. hallii]
MEHLSPGQICPSAFHLARLHCDPPVKDAADSDRGRAGPPPNCRCPLISPSLRFYPFHPPSKFRGNNSERATQWQLAMF